MGSNMADPGSSSGARPGGAEDRGGRFPLSVGLAPPERLPLDLSMKEEENRGPVKNKEDDQIRNQWGRGVPSRPWINRFHSSGRK